MTSRRQPNIEGQEPLFLGGDGSTSEYIDLSIVPWQQLEQNSLDETPVAQPETVGIYVDLAHRAENLDGSLSALSKRNQRIGFDIAAHVRPHSGPIWGRYQESTPAVIEGANRNVDALLDKAKRAFWAASGYSALKGSGLMSDEAIEAYAKRDWDIFRGRYGDAEKRTVRDKYRQKLRKLIKNSNRSNQATA